MEGECQAIIVIVLDRWTTILCLAMKLCYYLRQLYQFARFLSFSF
jgi:hypothetical protein